jgi:filamin
LIVQINGRATHCKRYIAEWFVSAAVVTTPSGQRHFPKLEDNRNGTVKIKYQPTEVGLHTLDVTYNQSPVAGSPFTFFVDSVGMGHVTAYGPGLSHGIAGQLCHFTIVTKDAGAGKSTGLCA